MIDQSVYDFLTEIVESRGLRLAGEPGETKAGGLRLDIRDPDVGPLFGTTRVVLPPPAPGWDAADAVEALERVCDGLASWDGERIQTLVDAQRYGAYKKAA